MVWKKVKGYKFGKWKDSKGNEVRIGYDDFSDIIDDADDEADYEPIYFVDINNGQQVIDKDMHYHKDALKEAKKVMKRIK